MDRDKREAAARAQAEDLKRERAAAKEKQGAEDRQRREKEPERHSDARWAAGSAGVRGADGKHAGRHHTGGSTWPWPWSAGHSWTPEGMQAP